MKRYRYSHWFWFFVLFFLICCVDCYLQLSEKGTLQEEYSTDWFLYSFISSITVAFTIYFGAIIFQMIRIPAIIADLLAFLLGILLYLGFAGKLWNELFWPYEQLEYQMDYSSVGMVFLLYVAYRILFAIFISTIRRFQTP